MKGTDFFMISPSSSSTILSTPWVAGCCGPMLMVMNLVSATVACPLFFLTQLNNERFVEVRTFHREILSQGMPLELFIKENPSQIWMALKPNTEHVINLPLEPLGCFPDARRSGDAFAIFEPHLHREPHLVLERIEKIDEFEAWSLFVVVNTKKIGQHVESTVRISLQEKEHF